ncbi:MarR family winged helix-turn-helix transcriptional regulator [Kineococcus gypseus]|uniref:MarR family winged helix-turn-helix transcriptional regulator n=1 Tax=Kineococcus gypseus TaxID=1637102 RepID=UPI003D7E2334
MDGGDEEGGGRGPLPVEEDLVLLLTAAAAGATAAVEDALAQAGFPLLRERHGYLVQHLVPGPQPVRVLAERLGVTQQGASKMVLELEQLGVVTKNAGRDARVREVSLTERGHAVVAAAREARRRFRDEQRRRTGAEEYERLRSAVEQVARSTGGLQALVDRRLRRD